MKPNGDLSTSGLTSGGGPCFRNKNDEGASSESSAASVENK